MVAKGVCLPRFPAMEEPMKVASMRVMPRPCDASKSHHVFTLEISLADVIGQCVTDALVTVFAFIGTSLGHMTVG